MGRNTLSLRKRTIRSVKRDAYAEVIGTDGAILLQAIYASEAPTWLREIPAVQLLRRVWVQQYTGCEDGQLRWRQVDELPPAAQRIRSPFDDEFRYCTKREIGWVGYKVHITETCDAEAPRIITQVETTLATTSDSRMITPIHERSSRKTCSPATIWWIPGIWMPNSWSPYASS